MRGAGRCGSRGTAWNQALYYIAAPRGAVCIGDQGAAGRGDAQPDENALTALLMRIPLHDPSTPFKGIRAVEGGQAIRIDAAEGESSAHVFLAG